MDVQLIFRRPRSALLVDQLEARLAPAIGIDLGDYSEDAVLVGLHDGAQPQSGWEALGAGIYRVTVPAGLGVENTITVLSAEPSVAFAEPDYRLRASELPNDPGFDLLWGLDNTGSNGGLRGADIGAEEAWNVTTGDGSIIVAVIDSGIDYTHPDLAANIWRNLDEIPNNGIDDDGNGYVDDTIGWDFLNRDNDPRDDNGHGTHVAGTIGAVGNNGRGVAGVLWDVQLMPLKFLDEDGSGSLSGAIAALNYAVANGAHVSNNSYGGGNFINSMYQAILRARDVGHIFVTAAGNEGRNNDASASYPASYPANNIISVAATDRSDRLASFSNYGDTSIDLGAPGVSIVSTYLDGTYARLSGTSMATPLVAGAAAMVRQLRPDWSAQQVVDHLLDHVTTTSGLQGLTVSGGRLNLGSAITSLEPIDSPVSPVVPPIVPPVPPTIVPPSPPIAPPPTVPVISPPVAPPPMTGSPSEDSPIVRFAVGTGSASPAMAALYDANGSLLFDVMPFETSFSGGIRVATGDVNGDGVEDLIVGSGPGRVAEVLVYDGVTGGLIRSLLPFERSFSGGVYVAGADFTGDDFAEIVVSADEGGGPRVRVLSGDDLGVVADFFGIDDPSFRGGARVGTGDLNRDGTEDLLVAAGFGGGPRIAGYDGARIGVGQSVKLFSDFFVFEEALRDGVFVTGGDIDGDGHAELIVTAGPGGGPRLYALSGFALVSPTQRFEQVANFLAGDPESRAGVRVAASDLDGDGLVELIVGSGRDSFVSVYDGARIPVNGSVAELFGATVFSGFIPGGVYVG